MLLRSEFDSFVGNSNSVVRSLVQCYFIGRNEEPHVKKRMGKHGEKVDLILRVDLVRKLPVLK